MGILMVALAAFLFVLLFVPWLLLVLSPLLVFAGSGSLLVRDLRRLHAHGTEIPDVGLLWLGGLERIGALEDRLGESIRRILTLAPAGAEARACACVKSTAQGPVSVVRVWGNGGHWLLRTTGGSIAEAAWRADEQLAAVRSGFPALPGIPRQAIPECNPGSCPMNRARRETLLATFAPA